MIDMLQKCKRRLRFLQVLWVVSLCLAVFCGCASDPPPHQVQRAFKFETDTFAFANELVWDYSFGTNGEWSAHKHEPKPDYTLHCLVLARSTRQFFDNARFVPDQLKTNKAAYRKEIRRVIAANPRKPLPDSEKINIPGYANLREFSADQEKLLKEGCGGAWESYFARGNWRMIFPFTRHQQAKVAQKLLDHLRPDRPLVVHLSRFPQLSINHTVLLFGVTQDDREIRFDTYDPNEPSKPTALVFDRASRTFLFPSNHYFSGGRVDVYEMFHRWDY